jgi:hypothetical protein
MSYSRLNPGPRYLELVAQYRQMHAEGVQCLGLSPAQTFPGLSLPAQAGRIKRLIAATGAANILDYGSGKGMQYDLRGVKADDGTEYESVQDYWEVDFIECYDPSYAPFSKLPTGKFDGVVSTDVLEHCTAEDLPWILDEIFAYARRFVFANVACFPAKKRLPTGENAHCTIMPAEWWIELLKGAAARHPALAWEFIIQWREGESVGSRFVETTIRSGGAE